jgi:hypothetical protein
MRNYLCAGAPMLATALIAIALPSMSAADIRSGVGEFGLTFGTVEANDFRFNADDFSFVSIKGSYSFPIGERLLLGFDADWRRANYSAAFGPALGEPPESQAQLGAHLLWSLNDDTRLGGFVSYGDTRMVDRPRDENYDYFLIGVEARHFFNDNLMGFAQLAAGDKVRDGDDAGEGFKNGAVVRLGATYFVADHSALTIDVEYAEASPYIDGNDDGRFTSVSFSGETRLATDLPLYATYSVSNVRIDSTTENDVVEELQVGVGIKVLFGKAASSRESFRAGRSIGLPTLPGRASGWTEFLD